MFGSIDESFDNEIPISNGYVDDEFSNYKRHKSSLGDHMDEFSFKIKPQQMPKSGFQQVNESTISLRQNLQHLEKSEIIEILLEEIRFNNSVKERNTKKQKGTSKTQNYGRGRNPQSQLWQETFGKGGGNKGQNIKYQKQYEELVKDFEEYIENTREAQEHYVKAIEELRKQNKSLQEQVKQQSNSTKSTLSPSPRSQVKDIQKTTLIRKLQQTVQHYLQINNELATRLQKVQKQRKQSVDAITILNEQNTQLKRECQKLRQEQERVNAENEELNMKIDQMEAEGEEVRKENEAFRGIVDDLKVYVQERRKARDSSLSVGEYEDEQQAQERKQVFNQGNLQHEQPSILANSQIKKIQDSSIALNQQSCYNLTTKPQCEASHHPSAQQQQFCINTFRVLQINNKELKLANMKLEQLLEKKSQKIRLLLEEIQVLTEDKVLMREEITLLKCEVKRGEIKGGEKEESRVVSENQKSRDKAESIVRMRKSTQIGCIKIANSLLSSKQSQNSSQANSRCIQSSKVSQVEQKPSSSISLKKLEQKNHSQQSSQLHKQQYYVAKALFSSKKKSLIQAKQTQNLKTEISHFSPLTQQNSIMRKRPNPYKYYGQHSQNNQDSLSSSKFTSGSKHGSKSRQRQVQYEEISLSGKQNFII